MRIGVGLPTTVPGADGRAMVEWARTADAGPFSSLAVLDRLVYESYEPLLTLAAAAAVTVRVKLATTIVIAPLRNTAVLAKEALTLHAISGGRLVFGLAVGARHDDYDAAGVDHKERGRRFAEQLASIRDLWEESPGPQPADGRYPPILLGGLSDHGFARMARYADGYVHGGGPPKVFARAVDKVHAAWNDSGRPGKPQIWGQGYFALGGEDAVAKGRDYLLDYYAFTGAFAEKIADGLLTTPQSISQFARGYAEAGCDELVLLPTLPGLDQLERLAQVVGALHEVTE
jgi:alkanesulfonate monooxygenase SsuD/methylene tetrahydromethanopterin reductase-like flavin-dependent oxidoreductase (luciferase family)